MATYPSGGYGGVQSRRDVRARDQSPESGGRPADNTRARSATGWQPTNVLRRSGRQLEQRNRRLESHRPPVQAPVEFVDLTMEQTSASSRGASGGAVPYAQFQEQSWLEASLEEERDVQIAIEASMNDEAPVREFKLNTGGEYYSTVHNSSVTEKFEREYKYFKRKGVELTEIRVGQRNDVTIVWPEVVMDFICDICKQLPFEPQVCKACPVKYCKRCAEIEGAYGYSCIVNRNLDRDAANFNEHQFCGCSRLNAKLISDKIKVACSFGCKDPVDPSKPLVMEWRSSFRHLREECKSAKCGMCGLMYLEADESHQTEADCLKAYKDFSMYLYGKAVHLAKRSSGSLRESNRMRGSLAKRLADTERTLDSARREIATLVRIRKQDLADYTWRVRQMTSEHVRRPDGLDRELSVRPKEPKKPLVRVAETQTVGVQLGVMEDNDPYAMVHPYDEFVVNTTNIQPRVSQLLTFVSYQNFGRRRVQASSDMSWKQLFESAFNEFRVPEYDRSNYLLLDLRMNLRKPTEEKVKSILRNVHTFHFVPKRLFQEDFTYRFKFQRAEPLYMPVELAQREGVQVDPFVLPRSQPSQILGGPVGFQRGQQRDSRQRGSSRRRRDMEPPSGPWVQNNERPEFPVSLGPLWAGSDDGSTQRDSSGRPNAPFN